MRERSEIYDDVQVEHVLLLAELGEHLHEGIIADGSLQIDVDSERGEPLDVKRREEANLTEEVEHVAHRLEVTRVVFE